MAKIAASIIFLQFIIVNIDELYSRDMETNEVIEQTETCCKKVIELDETEKKENFFSCVGSNHILSEENIDPRTESANQERFERLYQWRFRDKESDDTQRMGTKKRPFKNPFTGDFDEASFGSPSAWGFKEDNPFKWDFGADESGLMPGGGLGGSTPSFGSGFKPGGLTPSFGSGFKPGGLTPSFGSGTIGGGGGFGFSFGGIPSKPSGFGPEWGIGQGVPGWGFEDDGFKYPSTWGLKPGFKPGWGWKGKGCPPDDGKGSDEDKPEDKPGDPNDEGSDKGEDGPKEESSGEKADDFPNEEGSKKDGDPTVEGENEEGVTNPVEGRSSDGEVEESNEEGTNDEEIGDPAAESMEQNKQRAIEYVLKGNCNEATDEVRKMIKKVHKDKYSKDEDDVII